MNSKAMLLAAIPIALLLVILSGAADDIIYDLFCNRREACSALAIRDFKQVGVLIMFILAIVGIVGGARLKSSSPYAIVLALFVAVFVGVTALWGTVPDTLSVSEKLNSLSKSIYIAGVMFVAVLLPPLLIKEGDISRSLPHVYTLFAISLIVGLLLGFAIQGLLDVLWPASEYKSAAGTSKFVLTPASIVIATAAWGSLMTHPFFYRHKWNHELMPQHLWVLVFSVMAFVFAYGYGHVFLYESAEKPRQWVSSATLGQHHTGFIAIALLLPAMLIVCACAVFQKTRVWERTWAYLSVAAAIVHGLAAFSVGRLIERGRGPNYPFADSDTIPFILSHALSGVVGVLTILLVHKNMRQYSVTWLKRIETIIKPE